MLRDEWNDDQSKNVKIYVRILPLVERCENCAKISPDKKTIYVRCAQDMKEEKIQRSGDPRYWNFPTDGIFYNSSQKEIYDATMGETINNVLDGANFVLISCGQTGSGKTFTTGGLQNNWEHRGLVPRLVKDLMIEKERRKCTNRILYSLSHVEFRGRKFVDLLNDNFRNDAKNKQEMPKDIKRISVKSEKDVLGRIFQGEGRRAIAKFSEYPSCHLGTAVITFHVHNTSLITSRAVVSEATIHIVEMAGIDNTSKSGGLFKPLRDTIAANSMKLEIQRYLDRLGTEENKKHAKMPRTSCKLLKFLGDSLGPRSIIRVIAHIRVTRQDFDVTLSTLRFMGKIARIPEGKVIYNVKPRCEKIVEKLHGEIESLRRELRVNEMFFGQEAIMNVSRNRAEQIRHDFLEFLGGTINDIELLSLSQTQIFTSIVKEFFAKFHEEQKENVRKNAEKLERSLKNASRNISKTSLQESAKDTNRKSSNAKDDIEEKVGSLEKHGITLGQGISEVPAISGSNIRYLIPKGATFSKCHEDYSDSEEESSIRKRPETNARVTFEKLQRILRRVINKERLISQKG